MVPARNSDGDVLFRETTERFWLLRLVTEVRESGLFVRLEPVQRAFRRIPPERMESVSDTRYRAANYAGWHWGVRRTPGGNTVFRLRGDRGVEVVLTDDSRWFVGSQRPAELAAAIERVRPAD